MRRESGVARALERLCGEIRVPLDGGVVHALVGRQDFELVPQLEVRFGARVADAQRTDGDALERRRNHRAPQGPLFGQPGRRYGCSGDVQGRRRRGPNLARVFLVLILLLLLLLLLLRLLLVFVEHHVVTAVKAQGDGEALVLGALDLVVEPRRRRQRVREQVHVALDLLPARHHAAQQRRGVADRGLAGDGGGGAT